MLPVVTNGFHCVRESVLEADHLFYSQDMHYAEFAEDEVSNFVRLTLFSCRKE